MNLGNEEVTKIFRSLYLAEMEAGSRQELEDYQTMFPGHEELIQTLFERIDLGDGPNSEQLREMIFKIAQSGDHVGHYRLGREIGRGGQAVVYAATDEKLNRQVAVKILTRLDLGSESTLRRFQREAEHCSKLNHTSICTVYESGIHDGMPFIAMELIDGGTIAYRIDKSRLSNSTATEQSDEIFFPSITDKPAAPFEQSPDAPASKTEFMLPGKTEIKEILRTFQEVSAAMHIAHQAGIIHRDIKPGNIMVRASGTPVILDFGLAHDSESDRMEITQTGDFFGTPAYMSPEQISAHRIRLDHRTDIFSLGVSLYEALTLQRPFDSTSREEIYQSILTKEPAAPCKLNPSISRDIAVVIGKSMEKDRDRRYATAEEFGQDLGRILDLMPIMARPASLLLKTTRWIQRNRALAAFILVLPLVGVISILVADKVQEQRAAQQAETERESRWQALEEKFREFADIQSNAALAMIFQARSLRSITQDVDHLGEEARQWIREKVDDKSPQVRQAAIGVITQVGDMGAADVLLDHCLHDESQEIQLWCSQAMFRIPDDGLVPYLKRIVNESTNPGCKVNAIFGLAAFNDPEAAQLCLDMYHDESTSVAFKYPLAYNVLMLGTPGLEKMAGTFASKLRQDDLQGWGSVLEYYRRLETPEGTEKLTQYSQDESLLEMVRKIAAAYVKESDDKQSLGDKLSAEEKQKNTNE